MAVITKSVKAAKPETKKAAEYAQGCAEDQWNGQTMLVLFPEETFGKMKMSMSLGKVKKILSKVEDMKKFVAKHDKGD